MMAIIQDGWDFFNSPTVPGFPEKFLKKDAAKKEFLFLNTIHSLFKAA